MNNDAYSRTANLAEQVSLRFRKRQSIKIESGESFEKTAMSAFGVTHTDTDKHTHTRKLHMHLQTIMPILKSCNFTSLKKIA